MAAVLSSMWALSSRPFCVVVTNTILYMRVPKVLIRFLGAAVVLMADPKFIRNFVALELDQAGVSSWCENDCAQKNIMLMSSTLDTSHFDRSLLNDTATMNINCMFSTLDTSHFEMSPSNDSALANMLFISTTCDTSHFEMSPLNAFALKNIPCMSITFDTSHLEMSAWKDSIPRNKLFMSVTRDTSHSSIGPQVPAASPYRSPPLFIMSV